MTDDSDEQRIEAIGRYRETIFLERQYVCFDRFTDILDCRFFCFTLTDTTG